MNFWYPLNGAERVESNRITKLIPLYPFKIMKVGDWFFVPFSEKHPDAIRSASSAASKKLGIVLQVRRTVPGVTVTRIG